ncbi:type II toxin-antitoxin system RelE/ParE family toxin [Anaerovibrio sp. JC8]|uniref:type II toxin-antitoxin system RelE/ParE family toxin n=1 Tax=Anaerovibrio sp. JC8 TaxID=1240085 RepID=UPI000A118746|nr:type II toxin-antitoxin system RelE/ParE family toxin [Anaerovibrio sp. JC8]
MYNIRFYEDENGISETREYIRSIISKQDKNNRIKANKINDYMKVLRANGTRAGKPFVKHIDGDIWELRPLDDRFMFALWTGQTFLILNHFVKKSQKTPKREIDKAKSMLKNYVGRIGRDE